MPINSSQFFKSLAALFVTLSLSAPLSAAEGKWSPLPIVRQDILDAKISPGGEGCQRPQHLAVDSIDGKLMFYGTDVGGLFRSTDGGKTFRPANVNVESTGVSGVAIDPKNKDRVLLTGSSGGNRYNIFAGIHLSTDQGATWKRTFTRWLEGRDNGREQIAYDRSSFDEALGYCKTVYWVSQQDKQDDNGSLHKSTDGGQTWNKACRDREYEGGGEDVDSRIAVHPEKGIVYIANTKGFFRSTDGGVSFTKTATDSFRGLAVIPSKPDEVLAFAKHQIYHSTNSGETFDSFAPKGISGFKRVAVSPANPLRMVASDSSYKRAYSTDGGKTWKSSQEDFSNSWISTGCMADDRRCQAVWHPTDPAVVWGLGRGDQLMKSVDGGASFSWSSNGINGVMVGGGFNFDTQNPTVLYFGFQDYNGAISSNSGKSWQFINLSKHTSGPDDWGWVYGGFARDAKVMFGGNKPYKAGNYSLCITFDGGHRTETKVKRLGGLKVSYGDPSNPNVLFCWDHRSSDGGQNWSKMVDCDGVLTHHTQTKYLYGASGRNVVKSSDQGATWSKVVELPRSVSDVALDEKNDRLWIVANRKLYRCEAPTYQPSVIDGVSGCPAQSVAVDPSSPELIYCVGTVGTWRKSNHSVMHSRDGGKSWISLVNRTDLGFDGGNCAERVRVHPVSKNAYVSTNCFGVWVFTPHR